MIKKNSCYIKNTWVDAHGPVFDSKNPADETVVWQGSAADRTDVDRAVQAARESFQGWSQTDFEQRVHFLQTFANSLAGLQVGFAELISREMGKPYWEAKTEVGAMIRKVEISMKAWNERCGLVEAPIGEDGRRYTRYKPHGVLAVLGPFNLPGHLPNGHIIPALLAGNTVVYKPSEMTPLVAQWIMELWHEVGLPEGVLNMVQGGKETGLALVQHPDIAGVLFTGSAATGRAIHDSFGGRPEKILALEMGGNNPLIVWDVNDSHAAAYLTIQSAYITSGQRCVCARRLIIADKKEGNDFLDDLQSMIKRIIVGNPADRPEPFMGPMINREAALRVISAQEQLQRDGGKILIPCALKGDVGALLTPGLMDVTPCEDRTDNEIFGPFLQVIRVKSFDMAVAEANRTSFGLSAGLLSDDSSKYDKFLRQSRAGVVNWNRQITGASSEAPFGGIGQSGNHRPSAYFAADYCAYPVASIEASKVTMPEKKTPGLEP